LCGKNTPPKHKNLKIYTNIQNHFLCRVKCDIIPQISAISPTPTIAILTPQRRIATKKARRFIGILAVLIALCVLLTTAQAATIDYVECEDNLLWTQDAEGARAISGTGDIWDCVYDDSAYITLAPWGPIIPLWRSCWKMGLPPSATMCSATAAEGNVSFGLNVN